MNSLTEHDFLQKIFAEYYSSHAREIRPPSSLAQREFGFLLSREKMMIRHRSFNSPEELHGFLATNVPGDVYYSSAYYVYPTEPMERKEWLGADLIFDIDSDHLETPCKRDHDFWICENCSSSGRGGKPETCPTCGGTKFRMESWLCERCLDAVKAETQKLLDFLVSDFGFSPDETVTCFSGQRGYHVHIEEPDVRTLDQGARKEISDYITGLGVKPEFHGFGDPRAPMAGPELDDYGWSGRIAKGVYDLISSLSPGEYQKTEGVSKRAAKALVENKDQILETWGKASPRRIRSIDKDSWKALAMKGATMQASLIDTVVTTDIHRLIRLPLTLHGKTGLKAMEVPTQTLDRFDPLRDAVAFKEGNVRLFVNDAHAFRIGNHTYGPYDHAEADLPLAAAVYLLCKKAAKLVED